MKLFDSHCHLQLTQFDADRAEVLARMQDKEMGAVLIGTDLKESQEGLALAKQHNFLWASVGLHPTDNSQEEFDASAYEALARDPKVVAIGECGLDYFRSSGEGQKERFIAQLELALKLGKPLVIHCRDTQETDWKISGAHFDLQQLLQKYNERLKEKDVAVIMHFFTGSGALAQKYLDLGCHLSFPGPITYTNMYDESIRLCPLERLLIETDSPFAAPVPHRGQRNEPAYVADVAKKVAQIKGISEEAVAEASVKNAVRIFGLAQ